MTDTPLLIEREGAIAILTLNNPARAIRPRASGRIVNFSSYVATVGRERLAAYSASKGAVESLTRSVAAERAGTGVTCNAVAPGFFETDMSRPSAADPDRARVFRQAIAAHRFGQPAEMVGPVLFLVSDAASYVTGQVLGVDGGMSSILSLPATVPDNAPHSGSWAAERN